MWNRLRSITTGLWVSGQSRQGCPSYPRAAPLGSSHHHCHPRCHTKLEVGAFSIIELDNYWLDTILFAQRQLLLPLLLLLVVVSCVLLTALGFSSPVAGHIELEDHGVMYHPVDGRGGGHGVLEDLVPLGEDQV